MPQIDWARLRWLNEPPRWNVAEDGLSLTTGDKTDFWQGTFYGFRRDDGHFAHVAASGDFTAAVTFAGQYEALYDQAGLMVRIDAQHWVKLGIEHSDGVTNFSFVATRATSDWSVVSRPRLDGPQSVRVTRIGDALIAHYREPDGRWQLLRVTPFPAAADLMVGPMACSPQRAGFRARFTDLRIDPPIENPLHG